MVLPHVPSDASLDSWPLAPDSTPEYAVRCILDERTTRSGLHYLVDWRNYPAASSWEPAANLAGTTALSRWRSRAGPSGFTFSLRGNPCRLDALIDLPNLPCARLANLRNLRLPMDEQGVIRFERRYPIMAGGHIGGRASYYDTRGKGNTFLTCHESVRSYVFGDYYDEIDIARSHVSSVFGTWLTSSRTRPPSLCRFMHDQVALESDISYELAATRPALLADLNALLLSAQGVPTRAQGSAISRARLALGKSYMPPKQVYSAIINARSVEAWYRPFGSSPVLVQLVRDIRLMITAIPHHPLCAPLAGALRLAGRDPVYVISACLAHLDDAALTAAAAALASIDVLTSLTINDSLCISNDHSHSTHTVLLTAMQAASRRVGYAVDFKHLPALRKPTAPPPSFASVARLLVIDPSSPSPSPPPARTPPSSHSPSRSPSPRAPSPDLVSPFLASRLSLVPRLNGPIPAPLRPRARLPRASPSPTSSDDGTGVLSMSYRARAPCVAPPARPLAYCFTHLSPPSPTLVPPPPPSPSLRGPTSPVRSARASPSPSRSPDRILPPSQGPSSGCPPPPTLPDRLTSPIRAVLGAIRSVSRILTWRERLDKG